MKKSIFLILVLVLVAACTGNKETATTVEVYQCGDYTVYMDPYLEKTYDFSGGLLTRDGMEPVELNSSNIVKWPIIVGGDGQTEILSKSLTTPDNTMVFQLMRYETPDGVMDTEAIFSDTGIFKNGAQHIDCTFEGSK